jgi:hypothetical protein
MPSGRLCPRQDRVKCPLHGKVIPRDKVGQPSKVEDRVEEEMRKEEEMQKNPDWQDPKLLQDLKAATGIDLKVQKKGKGSSRAICYSIFLSLNSFLFP